jgi:hypothetical protein
MQSLLISSIKWKPPNRISIDLKVEVIKVLSDHESDIPPIRCRLYTWEGKENYQYFDQIDLDVEDIRSYDSTLICAQTVPLT